MTARRLENISAGFFIINNLKIMNNRKKVGEYQRWFFFNFSRLHFSSCHKTQTWGQSDEEVSALKLDIALCSDLDRLHLLSLVKHSLILMSCSQITLRPLRSNPFYLQILDLPNPSSSIYMIS